MSRKILIVALGIALVSLEHRTMKTVKQCDNLKNGLTILRSNTKTHKQVKNKKHCKHSAKNFKSKLTCKPNSVKKNFNSRRV